MKLYNLIFSAINQIKFLIFETVFLLFQRVKKRDMPTDDNPIIDIILPTYNRSEMLKSRSVPSVLNQSYKNFRLIIIGDCCNDDTEKVVNSFKDDRVIFFAFFFKK